MLAAMRAAVAAFLVFATWPVVAGAPTFESFRAAYRPSDAVLQDREGRPIGSLRTDAKARRLEWVALDDVSPAMVEALLAAEDKRFFEHGGVDWIAAASALVQQVVPDGVRGATRGASTITMQVAAMLDPALARGAAPRSWPQKFDQAQAAIELERSWTKPQILEAYLNSVTFRGELQGLRAASQGLLRKSPSGLDRQDSALLAALIRGPGASPPVAARRACRILETTRGEGTACDAGMLAEQLRQASGNPRAAEPLAPHAARRLLAGGHGVRSTLDARMQRIARDALAAQLALLSARGVEDGAAVVLDNRTGDVLAYVGSGGAFSRAPLVDAADSPRQAGSTLKPFLYAIAFERELLTPASLLEDSPLEVSTAAGLYTPRNYDLRYLGPVSVRRSLGSSLNVPAVRTIGLTGAAPLHALLQQLGVSSLHPDADHYGDSLALGSADVTLLALTNAYRTFANGGEYGEPRWRADAPLASRQRRISAATAWLIADILADNAARESTFGFDSVLATPFWTAVKTGTSKDMRDNWCIGFSAQYTVGVWVGNASGAPMKNVSGVSGAAPAWADIMRGVQAGLASRAPEPPTGVAARSVAFEADAEAPRREWFALRMAPPADAKGLVQLRQAAGPGRARIVAPLDGTLLAWDPDIPDSSQGLVARSEGAGAPHRWELDGKPLAEGPRAVLPLAAGRHVLVLRDAAGAAADRVTFEVRGGR